jgi:hypothetical protein
VAVAPTSWNRLNRTDAMQAVKTTDDVQQRRKSQILRLLERLLDDVEHDRMFGEFGVSFTCQNGQIGHIEEKRIQTYK